MIGCLYQASKAQFFKLLLRMQAMTVSCTFMYIHICARAALHSSRLNFEFLRKIFYD